MKDIIFNMRIALRPCRISQGTNPTQFNALFHQWTNDGMAIVEFEDGYIAYINALNVQFIDNQFNNYNFD